MVGRTQTVTRLGSTDVDLMLYKNLVRRALVHERLHKLTRRKVEDEAERYRDRQSRQCSAEYHQQQRRKTQTNEDGYKTSYRRVPVSV